MPRVRQTCTRCSMRRQKCDRRGGTQACSRCVSSGNGAICSLKWPDGYDASVHRIYPKDIASTKTSTAPTTSPASHADSSAAQMKNWTTSLHPCHRSESELVASLLQTQRETSDLFYLQSLLPPAARIHELVEYHIANLLWYHDCASAPLLRRQVDQATQVTGTLVLNNQNLQWSALLFAVLASSIACSDRCTAASWGFDESTKTDLSQRWYQASKTCLQSSDYMSHPHINSLQAIHILGMSAHLLGQSAEFYILSGICLPIAQSLGLHKLAHSSAADSWVTSSLDSDEAGGRALHRDLGRRNWARLCIQDWLSTVTSDMASINKRHFTTTLPLRLHEGTATRFAADSDLVIADLTAYTFRVASVLADFHDCLTDATGDEEQFDRLLKYEQKLWTMEKDPIHRALEQSSALWANLAKTSAKVLIANNVIRMHRKFYFKSFGCQRFAYSRWASIRAARTVIRETRVAWVNERMPMFWNSQSHLVGAGITLCLAILRGERDNESECADLKQSVSLATTLLAVYKDVSVLAERGGRVLSTLLQHATKQGLAREAPSSLSSEMDVIWRIVPRDGVDGDERADESEPSNGPEGLNTPGSWQKQTVPSAADLDQEAGDNTAFVSLFDADIPWMDFSEYLPPDIDISGAEIVG